MGAFSVWHWIVVIIVLPAVILPLVFYILSFRKTALAVNAAGGDAPVNLAWLLLIPLFATVWYFVLLIQLRGAMAKTGRIGIDPAWWTFGLIAGFGAVAQIVMGLIPLVGGMLALLCLLAQIVFAIFHWVNLVKVRKHFG